MSAIRSALIRRSWRSAFISVGMAKRGLAVAALEDVLLAHWDRRQHGDGHLPLREVDGERPLLAALRADALDVAEVGGVFTTAEEHGSAALHAVTGSRGDGECRVTGQSRAVPEGIASSATGLVRGPHCGGPPLL
jgi:hypothetical protein